MCTGVRWHPGVRVGRIACSTACPPRVHDGESAAAAELSGLPDSWRRCSPAPTRVTGLSAHRPVSTGTLDASASLLQSNCHRPNGCMYVSLKSQVSGVAAAAPVSCSVGRTWSSGTTSATTRRSDTRTGGHGERRYCWLCIVDRQCYSSTYVLETIKLQKFSSMELWSAEGLWVFQGILIARPHLNDDPR